jgi:hypothetical protein
MMTSSATVQPLVFFGDAVGERNGQKYFDIVCRTSWIRAEPTEPVEANDLHASRVR